MAKFIKYAEDLGSEKVVRYVNIDQVATAKWHQTDKLLELTLAGGGGVEELSGDEAVTAVKLLEQFA